MSAVDVSQMARVSISPEISGEVVEYGSASHMDAQQLQTERFARVLRASRRGDPDQTSYLQLTEFAPELRCPIVVWQITPSQSGREKRLIATAQVEFSNAMLISRLIALRPHSFAANLLAQGRVAEIGGFAARDDISRDMLVAAIDAIVATSIKLARLRGIEYFWIFPRNGFMSVMRAEIPGLLPPYHFVQSPDVMGWREDRPEAAEFRRSGLRGVSEEPSVFAISCTELAHDLDERTKLLSRRTELSDMLAQLLPRAMVRAQRSIVAEARSLREQHMSDVSDLGDVANVFGLQGEPDSFLPFGGDSGAAATYLRELREFGGASVRAYKALSYYLLDVCPGMHVLDVGCGVGDDLLHLARLVGDGGAVVGVDRDPRMVTEARNLVHRERLRNVWVFEDDAEQLHVRFPEHAFDRVRADRAVQHMRSPGAAIAEMWRVLRPGGKITLAEPDWGTMAIFPGGASGKDDDTALQLVLEWCRQHLAHALIGRQLPALLKHVSASAWSEAPQMAVHTYTFTSWSECDAVLRLSQAAAALEQETPSVSKDIGGWLSAVEMASEQGDFFAAVPLFFAYAVRAA